MRAPSTSTAAVVRFSPNRPGRRSRPSSVDHHAASSPVLASSSADDSTFRNAAYESDLFHQTSLGPAVPATYRRLAELNRTRLEIMHGSSFDGDCAALLRAMAGVHEQRCVGSWPAKAILGTNPTVDCPGPLPRPSAGSGCGAPRSSTRRDASQLHDRVIGARCGHVGW
jgi:hypothetical protein